MRYTPDLQVELIKAMYRHRVFDPDYRKSEKGSNDAIWERIMGEEPWSRYVATGQLSNWRALYGKGRDLVVDYEHKLQADKYHTGGGTLPKTWVDSCMKEMTSLLQVRVLQPPSH